jgi:hypothetical protein
MKPWLETELGRIPGRGGLAEAMRYLGIAHGQALFSGAALDGLLDRIKLGDPAQRFGGNWRACRLMQVVELPACVCPTGSQDNVAARGQPFEAGVTVNQEDALESFKVRGGALRLAVRTVEVDGGRRIGPTPRPIVARIDP